MSNEDNWIYVLWLFAIWFAITMSSCTQQNALRDVTKELREIKQELRK